MRLLRRDSRAVEEARSLLDPAHRYVDLAVQLRPIRKGPNGERIRLPLRPPVGYRWDRIAGRPVGPPVRALILDVREDSLPFFDALLHGDHEVLALWGGRQGGKSVTAAIAIILLALLNPGELLAIVSPAYPQSRSIVRRVLARLPAGWHYGLRRTPSPPQLPLANGAAIDFLSAVKPETLHGETYRAVLADEITLMRREAYVGIRPTGVVAGRRFRFVCTGTPNERRWVRELKRTLDAEHSGRAFTLPTTESPFLEPGQIEKLRAALGPYYYRLLILGLWPETEDLVYHRFKATQHEQDPPARRHETRAFCAWHQKIAAFHRPADFLVGHDWGSRVQASSIWQVWKLPSGRWVLWAVAEVVTEKTTDERHVRALLAELRRLGGLTAEQMPDALVVCDASDPTAQEGARVFRRHGLRVVPAAARNPPIEKRTAAVNNILDEMLHSSLPLVRIACGSFGEPRCEQLRYAMATQAPVDYGDRPAKPKKGEDGRAQDLSHYVDGAGYLLWWLYPVGALEPPLEEARVA